MSVDGVVLSIIDLFDDASETAVNDIFRTRDSFVRFLPGFSLGHYSESGFVNDWARAPLRAATKLSLHSVYALSCSSLLATYFLSRAFLRRALGYAAHERV